MEIRSTVFLARHESVVADFGEGAWRSFLAEYAKTAPVFAKLVLSVCVRPVNAVPDCLRTNGSCARRWSRALT
ncbi:hypothetical protein [Pyxidicoccus sp. MSG2]|uniref:hypothetical protein n=1 Tax=Pyxidicoccus sp. MSG2 TaxID=2996790 RepID=UPI0022703345|nr:hypothetical protein [Pyxidicoccus sp. MSG2]MCY1019904.1 hypothetical protein [Pyxidicoccus sp. MSG2]